MSKTLFIKTWGCQMNVYDSARMADVLAPMGYRPVDRPDDADMVILNTCHIREKAADKVFSELGRLRALKRRKAASGGRMILAVAGCVGQAEGAEIMARAPYVDLVFGPQTFHRLPDLVAKAFAGDGGLLDTEFPVESKFDFLPEEQAVTGSSAFLAVQEGCDKFCSFCVVPYTRGAEFSRSAAEILTEARRLIAGGACEITLLGQNVNAWAGAAPSGTGTWRLGRLVREVAALPGLTRLRYTTSHPNDMDDELLSAHGEVPALMPFVHLPIQSGSDRILAAMNRRHGADDYRRLVDRLRGFRPDIALSSDFIVGFPGESDADFADTLALVEHVGFAQAYSFKYSPRPGTPAADLTDRQVPEPVKVERLAALQDVLNRQQLAFNRGFVGTVLPVLFDRPGRRPGQLLGRSPYLHAVHAAADDRLLGTIAEVRITAAHANSLASRLVAAAPANQDALLAPEVTA